MFGKYVRKKSRAGHITGRKDLMWNTENSRKIALAEGRYVETGDSHYRKKKLSS